MSGLCHRRACFAERSLERALVRDAKRAGKAQRRFFLPGSRDFSLDALPPHVELRRLGGGWMLRHYQAPGRSA